MGHQPQNLDSCIKEIQSRVVPNGCGTIMRIHDRRKKNLAVFSVNMMSCYCYVNYELFQGFDSPTTIFAQTSHVHVYTRKMHVNNTTEKSVHGKNKEKVNDTINGVGSTRKEIHEVDPGHMTARSSTYLWQLTNVTNSTVSPTKKQRIPEIRVKQFNKKCPETERPVSIGTFEIPTQKDLVLFTKRTLLKQFNSYHEKTLYLLKDIKEATRATVEVEKKCHGTGKAPFKKCVKEVSKKCISITKDLVATLESQKAEVADLTEDKICTMTSMKTDPIQLIKVLAMDEATLDFALPAFLRLLGGCIAYCHKPSLPDRRPRLRKLTDQDLVVRHFLTGKNYMQLLKDPNMYV